MQGKHFSRWWPYTERSLALLAGKLVIITAGALLCKFAPLEAPANQWMAVFAGLLVFVPLAVKLPSALAKDAAQRSKDLVDSSDKLGAIEAAALLLAPQLEGAGMQSFGQMVASVLDMINAAKRQVGPARALLKV